ncbi:MAG: Gfo/Idh/MocA family oxidoreductase [Pirellulaceae bacterium]|jgi:predicted dehydrogenase|nr:Gfo/Idh/MocA family oxidoreductase [Pirellulaceae bacterium]
MSQSKSSRTGRRQFLKGATAVAGSAALLGQPALAAGFHHSVDDKLRVGLIGCGGRGTGAALDAAGADSNVALVAIADAFPDRVSVGARQLTRAFQEKFGDAAGEKIDLPEERQFVGLDSYKSVLECDVDVVLLTQPPYFRPESIKAAVAAGKHVFCEKPVAVDVPGVLKVLEACQNADGLNIVSGLCWRYDLGVRATMDKIREGAIGELVTIQENYLTGELWHRGNKPEWSPLENQIRNWLYYTWLSGDIPAEQHIHSLDKALWLMDDVPPTRCYGTGGRQKRTEEKYGNVYDHFASCFEWDNGVKCFSYCRQQNGCFNETEDHVWGTQGSAKILANRVSGPNGVWQYEGPKPSMYQVEHDHLFRAIRSGEKINNGDYMCKSTLMAIMAREVCYTGKSISWTELLADKTVLGPASLDEVDYVPPPVAIPGS